MQEENIAFLTPCKKRAPLVQSILPLGLNVGLGGQSALHIAATQATGSYVHPLRLTIHQHTNALYVRSPNAVGLAVGVAHVVAAHHALLAYLTKLAHTYTS